MRGQVHNAKNATTDGRDLWIASLTDDDGRFIGGMDAVQECDSEEDAIEWCGRALKIRQIDRPCTDLDDGSAIAHWLPRKKTAGSGGGSR